MAQNRGCNSNVRLDGATQGEHASISNCHRSMLCALFRQLPSQHGYFAVTPSQRVSVDLSDFSHAITPCVQLSPIRALFAGHVLRFLLPTARVKQLFLWPPELRVRARRPALLPLVVSARPIWLEIRHLSLDGRPNRGLTQPIWPYGAYLSLAERSDRARTLRLSGPLRSIDHTCPGRRVWSPFHASQDSACTRHSRLPLKIRRMMMQSFFSHFCRCICCVDDQPLGRQFILRYHTEMIYDEGHP